MNTYNPGSSFNFSSSWAKSRWHPVHKQYLPHRGEDWSASEGTAIPAAGDGTVVYKGILTGYGNVVVLEHVASDDGEIIHTLYAHMNKASPLIVGAIVNTGDPIGPVGDTGIGSGSHLHFEILRNGKKGSPNLVKGHETVNPREFDISRIRSGKTASTTIANDKPSLTSNFNFPIVNEKGEQYSNTDAIYKLLEKETSGFYLLSAHNFWHGGIHFTDVSVPHHIKDQPLRCMMDGKVIAYRLNKNYLTSNWLGNEMQYSSSFCLIQHEYESPANAEEGNNKGKKNKLTFYSLYMHLAPYSVYAFAADDVKKTKAKKQLKLIQTIRVRRGDDAVKGTPPSLGRLGAGSIVDLNGETSQFTVQEQGGSHSYTFAKGTISKACGKTDSHITEGTCIWVVDSAKYTEHVDQSTANKPCSPPAYWQCKMKGIVKNRVNAHQIKDNNQPFSDVNSESLGLLNITAEFEFNNKDVVTCSIGGKARKMAKATLLSGGYAEKAGQPPSPFWVCIDEPFVDLRAQAPTQFDSIVKCNQPIRAGDAIGFMGLYEVPKMPAACRQKVSKHQVHIEIFSTDSDSKIQAFLNNEAGLKTGKQYIKISAGASIYIKDKDTISFSTGGLKTQAECIVELSTCKKMSDSSSAIFYKVDKLPILNGAFDGYISEKELEILSQYELTKLGFKLLEEKNTNADGYLDPEKMPAFFQQLYKSIDKDGKNGVDSTEIAAAFKDQSKRNQLVKLVAKHPSEWHKSTINTIKTTFSNWASEATEDETKALMSHEKERMEKLEWMSQIAVAPLVFGPAVWHFNPIVVINNLKSSVVKGGDFSEADGKVALREIYDKYGKDMATIIERMYRDETRHFASTQYKKCGTGGMEAFGDSPYYGWDHSFFEKHPEYLPSGIWEAFENKGMSGQGGNKQVTDRKKKFVVFPSVIAGMEYKVFYINKHDGNWAGWHSTDSSIQVVYRQHIEGIKAKFVNEFSGDK